MKSQGSQYFLYTRICIYFLDGSSSRSEKSILKITELKQTNSIYLVLQSQPMPLLLYTKSQMLPKETFFFRFYVSAFLLCHILHPSLSHHFITVMRKSIHSFPLILHLHRIFFQMNHSNLIGKLCFLVGSTKGRI